MDAGCGMLTMIFGGIFVVAVAVPLFFNQPWILRVMDYIFFNPLLTLFLDLDKIRRRDERFPPRPLPTRGEGAEEPEPPEDGGGAAAPKDEEEP